MEIQRTLVFNIVVFSLVFLCTEMVVAQQINQFEGLIEPWEVVKVGTPVAGVVAKINVERSVSVKKGEDLVILESSVEDTVVEKAKVFAEVVGEIRLQEESLAFAKRVYKRVEELFNSEAISTEKYDKAKTEVTLARMRLQKARENKEIARLDLARAKAMLNQRTIKSPISGIVTERYVAAGEFVEAQPLVTVAQMDPLRVEIVLPASMFQMVQTGLLAEIVPETMQNDNYQATVTIVDRVIDPASGTFGVRLELPNPDYRLPSGLKCMVRFQDATVMNTLDDSGMNLTAKN